MSDWRIAKQSSFTPSDLKKDGQDEAKDIKTNLANKENEIEKVEYNIATATNPKVLEICTKQLEKLEAEREEIKAQLKEKGKEKNKHAETVGVVKPRTQKAHPETNFPGRDGLA